jgi:NADH-quinone oxidoreductase subunit J
MEEQMTTDLVFYLFAAFAVGCAFLVVLNPFSRSPVTSALFLVLTLMSLAGLFVLLHAFFLAAVQILIYAGAVMVLFLFVIMMLDLKEEERQGPGRIRLWAALGAAGLAGTGLIVSLAKAAAAAPGAATRPAVIEGQAAPLGKLLLTTYLLPFEIVSLILLVAMVGVVLLNKKDLQ